MKNQTNNATSTAVIPSAIVNAVIENRKTTNSVPLDSYPAGAEDKFAVLTRTMFNWAVADSNRQEYDLNKVFAAVRSVMTFYPVEGLKLRVDGEDFLRSLRDRVTTTGNVSSEAARELATKARQLRKRKAEILEDLTMDATGLPVLSASQQKALADVQAQIDKVTEDQTTLKKAGLHASVELKPVTYARMRKLIEDYVADMVTGYMQLTLEEREEIKRKEKQEKARKQREARKRKAEEAKKAAEAVKQEVTKNAAA